MHRPAHPGSLARWADDLARASGAADLAPADVLAGLAGRLGVGWDGPGSAVGLPNPLPAPVAAGAPWVLDAARQALLAAADPQRRRRLGAHHTPPELARRLAAIALEAPGPAFRQQHSGPEAESCRQNGWGTWGPVVDPSCGGGAFLLAAGGVLVTAGADAGELVRSGALRGVDVDPVAVATTRAALEAWSGSPPPTDAVAVGDGLEAHWLPAEGAGAVVGNPPFLSPLTAGAPAGRVAAYTDSAARFLLAAVQATRSGGRVVLVQPESILAARDAAGVRATVLEAAALEGLWVAGEAVFAAGVRVCAPVLRVGVEQTRSIRRWRGAAVRPVPAARVDVTALSTWAPIRPTDVPRAPKGVGRVGDLAGATAGFRDEYYGLVAAVDDAQDTTDPRPRLVTSGLVDPARIRWGERSARLGGRGYERPVVDIARLEGRVRTWTEARLVPKVLVATQTRVVEAAVDPDGRFVPVTPVIAVLPHDAADLHRLLAALLAPAATAWALRHYGGTALHGDAVKLSARQVLDIPLPAARAAWDAATAAVAAGDVDACAIALCDGNERLLAWYRERARTATRA